MMTNLSKNDLISQVNQVLDDLIPQSKLGTNLEESMQYSINAGVNAFARYYFFLHWIC